MHWTPFLKFLQIAGVPESFLRSWSSNLSNMTRKICIDDFIGNEISMTLGFPEGDP